jgi:hypothetical protein
LYVKKDNFLFRKFSFQRGYNLIGRVYALQA